MPLVIPKLTKDLESAILNELGTVFGKEAAADGSAHQKLASAIAKGVAKVIVEALQSDAQVLPGIGTAGSPSAQTSISPGKIF